MTQFEHSTQVSRVSEATSLSMVRKLARV